MTEQKVLFEELSPTVLHFKLNSPKSLNSVDLPMVNLMLDELKQWRRNPEKEPRVLMLSGVGGKAFCAGGDVVSVYKSAKGLIPEKNIPSEFFAREYLLDYTLSMMRATRQCVCDHRVCKLSRATNRLEVCARVSGDKTAETNLSRKYA